MFKFSLILVFILGLFFQSRASHVMGGELTWECQGGNYVFTLVFFRDCNGAEVNTVSENIRVWNHPTLTSINLPFVARLDISPTCNPVLGSPLPLSCGSGSNSGNGIGAIEKVIYKSAPIPIAGTPPIQGWVFTYENFSRSNALTNIANPSLYGITLAAKMYAFPGATGSCVDNSPVFLQEPYFVSCAGSPFTYNMNAVDPDLDSIAVNFGIPYTHFPTGAYDPPNNPSPIPFETGFSYLSPTPNTSLNGGNIPAQLDESSGELTFTSFTVGNYVVKVIVQSYRNGFLIAEVEREMQLAVIGCPAANNAPIISGPFAGGLFETTVNAGDLVNFNLTSSDIELLQDGSPQSNLLFASGPMFGTNYTSNSGCAIAPCATLNSAPIIIGTQGVTANFNWQTDCDHLIGANGNALDLIPYHFVFRVQDDFCQIPKVSYVTITINVSNQGVIQGPELTCIQSDAAGNVTLEWTPVADPNGTFVAYQVFSLENGLLATLPAIGATSWTDLGVTQQYNYYISAVSGCNGNTNRFSDTISNIFLELNNPINGTAILQWNDPLATPLASMNVFYHIYREYPTGTWTLLDSVSYGTNFYKDTIDICEAFLNYQIVLGNTPCDFTSNISGDTFEDMLTPDIPVITSVSIDTLSNAMTLNWNENAQEDTYGYVIYTYDSDGFLVELDTAWGISSTNYTYSPDITQGALTYSVAAFDSCYTPASPPTFQTSGKAFVHTTQFLETALNICAYEVDLVWTPYIGWNAVASYEIWAKVSNQNFELVGTTSNTTYTASVIGLENYCFFIKAISDQGIVSFSNRSCLSIVAPTQPDFHYLKVATVVNNAVELRHLVDLSGGVTGIVFEKMNKNGVFETLVEIPLSSNTLNYVDTDVDVANYSYSYRARIIDSCGKPGVVSNVAKTILLSIQKDAVRNINYIDWSPYSEFYGEVIGYAVYRGIDGIFTDVPVTVQNSNLRSFEDDLSTYEFTGKVCYYVDAIEGSNVFNAPERARSNVACEVFEPLIYIPNAFLPGGINSTFQPVLTNFSPIDYRFTIFDRWGQAIYQTDSPEGAWDGTISFSGELAETGSYIYMVVLHDGNGVEIVKRGFVTLLK
jgi:hypothetical protein